MVTSISSTLLAASMLLGQAPETQVIQQPGGKIIYSGNSTGAPTQPAPRPFFSWFSREDRPIKSRFQNWFGRKDQEPPLQSPPSVILDGTRTNYPSITPTAPTPLDFPKKMPSPAIQGGLSRETPAPMAPQSPKGLQQINLQVPTSNAKSPILAELANNIGRDDRFEWVTGQLELEHGSYVLYYATPETVDKYNGRIVMHPQQVDMSQFRRGDLVSVRGDVIQKQMPQGMIPVYRASDVQMIKRVKS